MFEKLVLRRDRVSSKNWASTSAVFDDRLSFVITADHPIRSREVKAPFVFGDARAGFEAKFIPVSGGPKLRILSPPEAILPGLCRAAAARCLHVSGKGFQRGTYLCQCKRGYYFPPDAVSYEDNTRSPAFLGSAIEEEYNKKAYGLENDYDSAFDCLPCQPGCDECDDDSPCLVRPNITLRWCFLGANLICIILLVVLGIYTYRHREIRIFKAASPGLLYVILIGTGLSYCETIISIAAPIGLVSCQGLLWFRYLGFWLAYGALLFKTWRITKVFTVRSAKPVRITDRSLFLRIGILLAIFVVFLTAWTFLGPSEGQRVHNQAGLKYFRCSQNSWNYASKAGELILLIWGMYLCFKVRKAPSAFNESRYISVSIYNEALISIFGAVVSFVIPAEFAGPDTFLIINFIRLHATFTVMVALLFVSKICMFYRTNTDKKKAESKKSQVVFTIDNSSVIIDFSHENPEVSVSYEKHNMKLIPISMSLFHFLDRWRHPGAGRKGHNRSICTVCLNLWIIITLHHLF
nr:probable G-protein coupled receptor CG31760 [Lytechinus pictus]